MKNLIISFLQKLLGFHTYLLLFSIFTILKLRYDKNEKDFLKLFDLIKDDGLVLDIGANIGVMTYHFAKKLRNSQVLAFEPVPYNIRALQRIIKLFRLKNVRIFEIALSDADGNLTMIMPLIDSARKQGLSHVDGIDEKAHEGERFEVDARRLDNISEILNTSERITAIKIDVEGYELNVLKGAVETIRKHKPIIYCELWPGKHRNETIGYMRNLNYSVNVIDGNDFVEFVDQQTQNFFFISC